MYVTMQLQFFLNPWKLVSTNLSTITLLFQYLQNNLNLQFVYLILQVKVWLSTNVIKNKELTDHELRSLYIAYTWSVCFWHFFYFTWARNRQKLAFKSVKNKQHAFKHCPSNIMYLFILMGNINLISRQRNVIVQSEGKTINRYQYNLLPRNCRTNSVDWVPSFDRAGHFDFMRW